MRDDRLQGILFSRSELVDLSHQSHLDQFLASVNKQRRSLRDKRGNIADVIVRVNPLRITKDRRTESRRSGIIERINVRLP